MRMIRKRLEGPIKYPKPQWVPIPEILFEDFLNGMPHERVELTDNRTYWYTTPLHLATGRPPFAKKEKDYREVDAPVYAKFLKEKMVWMQNATTLLQNEHKRVTAEDTAHKKWVEMYEPTISSVRACEIIGEWYMRWKDKITNEGSTHRLGYAKEDLKDRFCKESEKYGTSI